MTHCVHPPCQSSAPDKTKRTVATQVRVTLDESAAWKNAAGLEGVSLSTWMRRRLNLAAADRVAFAIDLQHALDLRKRLTEMDKAISDAYSTIPAEVSNFLFAAIDAARQGPMSHLVDTLQRRAQT